MKTQLQQFIRDLPVKRKLMLIVLATSATILLLACTSLFFFQIYLFKQSFKRDVQSLAEVVAANSIGPVSFHDQDAARDILTTLKSRPQIISASLYLPDGKCWVNVDNAPPAGSVQPERGMKVYQSEYSLTQPLTLRGENLGTLCVRANFNATYRDLLAVYVGGLSLVSCISFLVALALSSRLQRLISDPILHLSSVVRTITANKDYSHRAAAAGRDELGQLTDSFNKMIGEIQNHDQVLRESEERFRQLAENISEVFWMTDAATNRMIYISPAYATVWGRSCESFFASPCDWMAAVHPDDRERVTKAAETKQVKGEYNEQYRILRPDGSLRWIQDRAFPVGDAQGRIFRVVGIAADITARKEAEQEMERLNREFAVASRQAGMAEVATGVLHNVGNVLNSVGVSATLITDSLKQPMVRDLCRATKMLLEKNGNLAAFLTHDPKGRILPEFLGSVAEQLSAEQTRLLAEAAALSRNIDHIKEIVAMQQSYARISGVLEHLHPTELVEDALRLNAAAFERHRVEVVREYAENLPRINVDRHKVLQILINLVRNAKYALDAGNPVEKRLVVQVETDASGTVAIRVCDNGSGIPRENLTRIFQHGFTTKKDGHGFGLHSGANAAKAMGGRLIAESDGPGQGATFTLELPAAKTEDAAKS